VFVIHLYNDVSRSVYFIKTIQPWIMCISSWTNNHSTVNHVFIQPWHISEKNHCSYCVHNDYTIIKYINQQCTGCVYTINVRDQPFNLKGRGGYGFLFRSEFFFGRAKGELFFQNLTLGYMTKTLNQIMFFSFTKIRIFFSVTLGIRIFF
jgi:hypothetical protein